MPSTTGKVSKKVAKGVKSKINKIIHEIPDVNEQELEALVFGGSRTEVLNTLQEAGNTIVQTPEVQVEFFIDTNGAAEEDEEPVDELPVWIDQDTEMQVDIQSSRRLRKLKTDFDEVSISATTYESRLRAQFEKMNPAPAWAQKDTEKPLELEMMQSTNALITKSSKALNPDKLDILRLKDANQKAYSKFHPTAPVLLTAGFDKSLRLFQIDGKINPKLSSTTFSDMPIYKAIFSPDGTQAILTGRRKFFFVHDLVSGKSQKIIGIRGRDEKSFENSYISPCNKYMVVLGRDGYIILLSMLTKQWSANLKINGQVTCIAFSKHYIFALGSDCEVYQFDLESHECLHRFVDHGCIKPTHLAISPDSNWIASGSSTGIVNLYAMTTALASSTPEPVKAIMNLVAPITTLKFHPCSLMLVMSAKEIKDSLRIFHIPTLRVVKNWPTATTPLGYVSDFDISSDGKLLAIGNAKGKVLLYRFGAF